MKKYSLMMPGQTTSTGRRDLQGEYSRRINEKDRLVYHMEDGRLYIAHCRGHYGDK